MKLPISRGTARQILIQLGLDGDDEPRLPWRRCSRCGLGWPRDQVSLLVDEDGRSLGYVCQECQ